MARPHPPGGQGVPRARGDAGAASVLLCLDPRNLHNRNLPHLPGAAVLRVGAHQDGVRALAAALAEHPGVRAVVVGVHTEAGRAMLGSAVLAPETLARHAMPLHRIGRMLGAQGVVLLYGAVVGTVLAEAVAGHTGTVVAAISSAAMADLAAEPSCPADEAVDARGTGH